MHEIDENACFLVESGLIMVMLWLKMVINVVALLSLNTKAAFFFLNIQLTVKQRY